MNRRRLVRLGAVVVGLAVVVAVAYMVALRFAVTTGDFPEGVEIRNGTEITVAVFTDSPAAGELRFALLVPDGTTEQVGMLGNDGCTRVELIARTEDGTEVDRRPPPFCAGEGWVIEDDR